MFHLPGSWHPPCAPTIPNAPETTSHLPPESAYFLSVNRNKRSLTVNFKRPEGLEIMRELIKDADVLVENFVTGKLAKLGLGWEDCKKINPRLIYASVTGMRSFPPSVGAGQIDELLQRVRADWSLRR
jgi:succinate--hydroxymethylglutarate CoA-transferase